MAYNARLEMSVYAMALHKAGFCLDIKMDTLITQISNAIDAFPDTENEAEYALGLEGSCRAIVSAVCRLDLDSSEGKRATDLLMRCALLMQGDHVDADADAINADEISRNAIVPKGQQARIICVSDETAQLLHALVLGAQKAKAAKHLSASEIRGLEIAERQMRPSYDQGQIGDAGGFAHHILFVMHTMGTFPDAQIMLRNGQREHIEDDGLYYLGDLSDTYSDFRSDLGADAAQEYLAWLDDTI